LAGAEEVLEIFQQRVLALTVVLAEEGVLAIRLAQEPTQEQELLGKEILAVSFILTQLLTA
jgi:hypothetical protein